MTLIKRTNGDNMAKTSDIREVLPLKMNHPVNCFVAIDVGKVLETFAEMSDGMAFLMVRGRGVLCEVVTWEMTTTIKELLGGVTVHENEGLLIPAKTARRRGKIVSAALASADGPKAASTGTRPVAARPRRKAK